MYLRRIDLCNLEQVAGLKATVFGISLNTTHPSTSVSKLDLRLKDLLGPVTRVKKKKKAFTFEAEAPRHSLGRGCQKSILLFSKVNTAPTGAGAESDGVRHLAQRGARI